MQKPKASSEEKEYLSFVAVMLRVVTANWGNFYFGYSMGILNLSMDNILKVLHINPSEVSTFKGILNALMPAGAILGAVCAPLLLRQLQRRKSLILADLCGILAAIISLFANMYTFFVYRFVQGIATGINSAIVSIYIREFSPLQIYGAIGFSNQFFILFGVFFSYVLGYVFANPLWRLAFAFPFVTCSLRSALFLTVYTQDTPFSYVMQNDEARCREVLSTIYGDKYIEKQAQLAQDQFAKMKASSMGYSDLIKPNMLRRLVVGSMLMILQQLSGINAVNFYSNDIFKEATHGNKFLSFILCVCIPIFKMMITVITAYMTKVFGRKQNIYQGSVICIVALSSLCVSAVLYHNLDQQNDVYQDLIIAFIYVFMVGYSIGIGPIAWVNLVEILPEKGVSIAIICNWVCVVFITFFFPLCQKWFDIGPIFGFFAVTQIFGVIFLGFFMEETKGLTNQEID